ncbi:hypothetical protein HDU85_005146 [Gaertneriomyces sp. JEL0708]|nr:hypothetical protein HDU85_005146 [Gaertneriomyces sp. JEL0708]
MKKNSNTVIVGSKVVLVPYKPEHVATYHEWMKDPFLQEMTASEPLSLEEEYAMQRSWFEDEEKCTFIVLSPTLERNRVGASANWGGMAGDVNLFFNDHEDIHSAELELMIAEQSCRRQGLGLESALLMMQYAVTNLDVTTFTTKISLNNSSSLALFKNKLGFIEVSVSEVFQEVTLERKVDHALREFLASRTHGLRETVFEE